MLINDESIPTFFHTGSQPQVNDLMWIHSDLFLSLTIDVAYNIFGVHIDHQFLDLQFGNNTDKSHSFDQVLPEH